MRLSEFILENMEPILQEWEDFARALGAVTESMDAKALRDHAKQILRDVAADLKTYQSGAQQEAKSKGHAPAAPSEDVDSGAEQHGDVRATEGFTLEQMLSEYRALRASVLRLWTKKGGIDDTSEAEQITRFNEAIDEALAKSAMRYARDVERLIASAHGKERMAALGTLSAGLGHDMSNVLLPMRVSLEKLEQTALPPESKPMLDSLHRAMEHLRGLTRGLRSLSVNPEETEASPATTQLHAWWADATLPYKWALSPEVKLHASGLESLALPAVAVPKHVLMQAVFNLVQNAAESLSTQRGGNIWLSATVAEDGATVSLGVRDDGPGMDPETLARCTEPFFTTKPRGRGTGLGLSLVRTAVERHGGRLVIESSPNKGSTFTLVLPVTQRGDQPRVVRRAILTVGDARVRAMIAALLSGVGVEVPVQHHSGGAAVGLEKATARAFLWVADDSVDPVEVLRFLDEGGPRVRVVVLGSWMPMGPGERGRSRRSRWTLDPDRRCALSHQSTGCPAPSGDRMGAVSRVRILCVDDNEEILWALGVHFAATKGFEVVGSLSSATGLTAAVKDTKPDILVLDLDMPGKSPLQALREVSRSRALTRTVVFSGHLRRELVDQAMDAGAWGYVSKNDGEVFLAAAIRAVMAGEIAWSPEVQSVIAQR